MNRIGRYIETLRNSAGMSQEQLARKIGKTRSAVSQYESGKIVPRVDIMFRIADVFGVPPAAIIDGGPPEGGVIDAALLAETGMIVPREYVSLSAEEKELIECFRASTRREKTALMTVARTYSDGGLALNGEDAQEGIA